MRRNVEVTIRGPYFDKRIDKVVEQAIVQEGIEKVGERLTRKGAQGSGGKGLGVKRNVVRRTKHGMEEEIASTLRRPRTKGTAWTRKNMGIAKAMLPRVLKKTSARIVGELS